MRQKLRYGGHASQYVEAWIPEGERSHPVAVVIHGGWWRTPYDLHLMDGLCEDLRQQGWLAWNVEYRRMGGGGAWATTLEDVVRAVELLRRCPISVDPSRIVAIGHSAGAHLALLAAPRTPFTAVVAQAPVTDVRRCAEEGLGEHAVRAFLGGLPAEVPARYRAASPASTLPLGIPQLVVHGTEDARVPADMSRDWVALARAAGDRVDHVEIGGADHFTVIDPTAAPWRQTVAWLDGLDAPPALLGSGAGPISGRAGGR